MSRRRTNTWLAGGAAIALLGAVAAAPPVRFAVVSIKPVGRQAVMLPKPGDPGPVYAGGKYIERRANVWTLLSFAYPQFAAAQTEVGLPQWALSQHFAIEAEPAPGAVPSLAQTRAMVQTLLADRFGLKFHTEKRSMPVFFMTVAQGGVRNITPAKAGEAYASPFIAMRQGAVVVEGRAVTMSDVAADLWLRVGRPVVDRTGMKGAYDIKAVADTAGARDFARVFQRDLGLPLVPGNASVPVMVIDHLEQPRGN